jgi:hypothetical protein
MREQFVVFQVQIIVRRGIAKFPHPLPCGLTEIHHKHGWVALEPSFCGALAGPRQHLQYLIGQIESLFTVHSKGQKLCKSVLDANTTLMGLTTLLKEEEKNKNKAATADSDPSGDDDNEEKEDPTCSLDRAKEAIGQHQQITLARLQREGCVAKVRLISFRRDEVLQEVDTPYGVDVMAGDLPGIPVR